jgi:hypothetical protein
MHRKIQDVKGLRVQDLNCNVIYLSHYLYFLVSNMVCVY